MCTWHRNLLCNLHLTRCQRSEARISYTHFKHVNMLLFFRHTVWYVWSSRVSYHLLTLSADDPPMSIMLFIRRLVNVAMSCSVGVGTASARKLHKMSDAAAKSVQCRIMKGGGKMNVDVEKKESEGGSNSLNSVRAPSLFI